MRKSIIQYIRSHYIQSSYIQYLNIRSRSGSFVTISILLTVLIAAFAQSCTTESLVKEEGANRAPAWYQPSKTAQWTPSGTMGAGYAVSRDSLQALQLARETALSRLRTAVHLYTEHLRESEEAPQQLDEPNFMIQLRTITDNLPLRKRSEETSVYKTDDGIYHQFVLYRFAQSDLIAEFRETSIAPAYMALLEADSGQAIPN